MKSLTIKNFIPGIAWFFVVLILICLPSDEIPQPQKWFDWARLIRFDSIVHCCIFGFLSYLFIRPIGRSGSFTNRQKSNHILKITIATVIWGITTEFIQKFFIPTRSFELVDWAADCAGALAAFLLCRRWFLKHGPKSNTAMQS